MNKPLDELKVAMIGWYSYKITLQCLFWAKHMKFYSLRHFLVVVLVVVLQWAINWWNWKLLLRVLMLRNCQLNDWIYIIEMSVRGTKNEKILIPCFWTILSIHVLASSLKALGQIHKMMTIVEWFVANSNTIGRVPCIVIISAKYSIILGDSKRCMFAQFWFDDWQKVVMEN